MYVMYTYLYMYVYTYIDIYTYIYTYTYTYIYIHIYQRIFTIQAPQIWLYWAQKNTNDGGTGAPRRHALSTWLCPS